MPAFFKSEICVSRLHHCSHVEDFVAEGAEEGTAPLRSALFLVFMSSVTFLRPDVTVPPCSQAHSLNGPMQSHQGTNTHFSWDMITPAFSSLQHYADESTMNAFVIDGSVCDSS